MRGNFYFLSQQKKLGSANRKSKNYQSASSLLLSNETSQGAQPGFEPGTLRYEGAVTAELQLFFCFRLERRMGGGDEDGPAEHPAAGGRAHGPPRV
jgi:hypothetical protein